MLVDILSMVTKMPVLEAKEGTQIEAGHAYLIPPGKFLSLQQGALSLTSPAADGVRMPIDFLFRSLAKKRAKRPLASFFQVPAPTVP